MPRSFARPRPRSYRAKKGTYRRRYVPRKGNNKAVKFNKKVMNVMNKQLETKMKQKTLADQVDVPGTGAFVTGTGTTNAGFHLINLLGSNGCGLEQGTGVNQRVGIKVQPTRLNVKGFIYSKIWSQSTNPSVLPFEVHILFYKQKDNPIGNPNDIIYTEARSQTHIDGSAVRELFDWNTGEYVIKKHIVRRLKAYPAFTSNATQNEEIINTTVGSSNNQNFFKFNCNVNIKKELIYPQGTAVSADTPTNDWLNMAVYVINGDGQPISVLQSRARLSAVATLHYKDA